MKKKLQQFISLARYHAVLYIRSTAVCYSTPLYFPLFKKIRSATDIDNDEEVRQGRTGQLLLVFHPILTALLSSMQHEDMTLQHITWHMAPHMMA